MSSLAPVEGGRALLFERLVDLDPGRGEAPPFVLHGREGLKASLAYELERLLSTRVPVAVEILTGRERSTIDYGIPDGALTVPADPGGRQKLAEQVRLAVLAFEPRLQDPKVSMRLADGRGDALIADITGWLEMGAQREPVSFAVSLNGAGAEGGGHGG